MTRRFAWPWFIPRTVARASTWPAKGVPTQPPSCGISIDPNMRCDSNMMWVGAGISTEAYIVGGNTRLALSRRHCAARNALLCNLSFSEAASQIVRSIDPLKATADKDSGGEA